MTYFLRNPGTGTIGDGISDDHVDDPTILHDDPTNRPSPTPYDTSPSQKNSLHDASDTLFWFFRSNPCR